jgi:hypothetical protein
MLLYVHTNIWLRELTGSGGGGRYSINQLVKLRSLLNYRQTTSPADRNIAIYRLKGEYICGLLHSLLKGECARARKW